MTALTRRICRGRRCLFLTSPGRSPQIWDCKMSKRTRQRTLDTLERSEILFQLFVQKFKSRG
jgi:hypothetical protein